MAVESPEELLQVLEWGQYRVGAIWIALIPAIVVREEHERNGEPLDGAETLEHARTTPSGDVGNEGIPENKALEIGNVNDHVVVKADDVAVSTGETTSRVLKEDRSRFYNELALDFREDEEAGS